MRAWLLLATLGVAAACTDGNESARGGAGVGGSAGTTAGSSGAGGSTNGAGAAGASAAGSGASDASGDAIRDRDGISDGDALADASGPTHPADVLDLTDWKLTLPIGTPGSPTEIRQPALRTFSMPPYFHVDTTGTGVVFQAHAGGVTTSNSGYPRSELREMTAGGTQNAAWSTTSGTHTMTITQTITHLPVAKPHVVAGQIHDAADDVVMIRLEGANLFVEGGGNDLGTLNPNYMLGARFTVRLVAAGGRIRVFYEDLVTPKVDIASTKSDCYFKAGTYTQSNPAQGDDPSAYGEVVIHALAVTHL